MNKKYFKYILIIVINLFNNSTLFCQFPFEIATQGNESPILIADSLSINYGIHPILIQKLLNCYPKKGSAKNNYNKVEQLLSLYKNISLDGVLSEEDISSIGLSSLSETASALRWDMYMKTFGDNSPIMYSPGGKIEIWYGLPEKTFKAIHFRLEELSLSAELYQKKIDDIVEKYHKLQLIVEKHEKIGMGNDSLRLYLLNGDLEKAEKTLSTPPTSIEIDLALRNYLKGEVKYLLLKYQEALIAYQTAYNIDDKVEYLIEYINVLNLLGKHSLSENILIQYANMYSGTINLYTQNLLNILVANVFRLNGNYEASISSYKNVITYYKQDSISNLTNLAAQYSNIAIVYSLNDQLDSALLYANNSLGLAYSLYGSYHEDIGAIASVIAQIHLLSEDYSTAREFYNIALTLSKSFYGENHPHTAVAHNNIANCYQNIANFDKAYFHIHEAIRIDSIYYELDDSRFITRYVNLGVILNGLGKYEEALDKLKKAEDISSKKLTEYNPEFLKILLNKVNSLINLKRYEEASFQLSKSTLIANKVLDSEHTNHLVIKIQQAKVEYRTGNYKEAIKLSNELLSSLDRFKKKSYELRSIAHQCISISMIEINDIENAILHINKAIEIDTLIKSSNHPDIGIHYNNLASAYDKIDEDNIAIKYYKKSLDILSLVHEYEHSDIIIIKNNLLLCNADLGDKLFELKHFKKALFHYTESYNISLESRNTNRIVYYLFKIAECHKYLQNCDKLIKVLYDIDVNLAQRNKVINYINSITTEMDSKAEEEMNSSITWLKKMKANRYYLDIGYQYLCTSEKEGKKALNLTIKKAKRRKNRSLYLRLKNEQKTLKLISKSKYK